jgi:hypothetical protein
MTKNNYTEADLKTAYDAGSNYSKGSIADAQKYRFDNILKSLQPQESKEPAPAAPVKEPLGITPGEWLYTVGDNTDFYDIDADERVCSIYRLSETFGELEAEHNAKAICTAINETYGKGYNPEAMEGLVKASVAILNWVKGHDAISFLEEDDIKRLEQAIMNAKL